MFQKVDPKQSLPKLEEEILQFWQKEKIFQKSVEKEAPQGNFVFYEGPPTANGKPGLHHVLARAFKDIIPRYKTMKGYRVERKAGWDTHGLPVEIQVEKALGLKNKRDIENIVPGDVRASIIEFNKRCKESVFEYRDLWEKITERMGYWVDMEHPYVTYENTYIESVWWQLAQIAKLKVKNEEVLYKGHKVVPYCYRCGTVLSSHEVAQGYREVEDNSVYVKFKAQPDPGKGIDGNTYFLAWTTTPWTLPGNVALTVHPEVNYVLAKVGEEKFIVAEKLVPKLFEKFTVEKVFSGKDLFGLRYECLFGNTEKDMPHCYQIVAGDFVSLDEGTGIVHMAPAFGEDDAEVAKKNNLPTLHTVDAEGKIIVNVPGQGIPVKKKNDKNRYAADDLIIEDLKKRNLLFREEMHRHEYPFCWRCDTPLIYFAKPSWFIRMSALQKELTDNNEKVNWIPEHIKEGRFGEWLRGAKDWAISRERYWGTPLPIWVCEKCEKHHVVSSAEELTMLSGKTLEDLHKPYVDDLTWQCECGGTMKRTPEVLDVWFDSGAMPLAQFSYPNQASEEEKKKIEKGETFPADYISEAIDQTRGWFYTLHAIATLLEKAGVVETGNAYKHVICLGHILDAQGKKMSKSKGNVIEPFQMFDEFGADPLRWMLFSINQPGLPKCFDVKGMRDVMNRVFRMLWNSYSFFVTYASIEKWAPSAKTTEGQASSSKNLLDRWILSELHVLLKDVTESLDRYDVYGPTQRIESFIDHLSNWYIRRSRRRFSRSDDTEDKESALATLHTVLVTLAKVMAPFTPFLAEEMYRNLTLPNAKAIGGGQAGEESVHLADFPEMDERLIDEKLNSLMRDVREIVSAGLQKRAEAKIKVRQPLKEIRLRSDKYEKLFDAISDPQDRMFLERIIFEELNVKFIYFDGVATEDVVLNVEITPELKLEGEAREIIRAIQEGRKKAKFNVEDKIVLGYKGKENIFKNPQLKVMIEKEVLATDIKNSELPDAEYSETVKIEKEDFSFTLKR